jgi:hypothetical protein
MTAMTAQISAMRTTWTVFTDLVLVIREARNDPRSSTAFAAPLASRTGARAGCQAVQPGAHLLVDLRADPLDQPQAPPELRQALRAIDQHIDDYINQARLGKAV